MKKNILRNKALIAYVSSLLLLGSAIAYEVTTEEVTITTNGRVVVNRDDQASKTTIGAIQGDVKLESKSGDTLSMKVGETKIVDEDGNINNLSSKEYEKIIKENNDLNDSVVIATVKEPASLSIVENAQRTLSVKLNKHEYDKNVVVKFSVVADQRDHLRFQGGETDYEEILTFTKNDWNTAQNLVITAKEIAGDGTTDSKIHQTIKVGEGVESQPVEIPVTVVAVEPKIVPAVAEDIELTVGTKLLADDLKAKVTLSGGGDTNDEISEWSITSVAYKGDGTQSDLTTTGGIDITGAVVSTGEASTWTIRFANGSQNIDVDLKFKVVAVEPKIVPAVAEDIELTVGTTLNAGDLKDKVQLSGGGAGNDAIADWTITSVAYKGDGTQSDLTTTGGIDITGAVVSTGEASTWTITFTDGVKNIPVDLKFKVVAVEPKIVPAVAEDIELTVGTTLNAADLKDKVQLSGGGESNDNISDWTITKVTYKDSGQSGDLTTTGGIDITGAVVSTGEASTWTITFTDGVKNIPVDLKFKVVAVEPKIVPAVAEDIELTVGTTLNAADLKDKVQLSGGGESNDNISDWTITKVTYKDSGQSGDLTTTGGIDITGAVVSTGEASTWTITFTDGVKNIPVDLKFKVVAVEPKIVPADGDDISVPKGTTLNAGDLKDKVTLSGGGESNDDISEWSITKIEYKSDGTESDFTPTRDTITGEAVSTEASKWTITFNDGAKDIEVELKFEVVAVDPTIVATDADATISVPKGTTLDAAALKAKVTLSGGGESNDDISEWSITKIEYKSDGTESDFTPTRDTITGEAVSTEASKWTITFNDGAKDIEVELKFEVVAVDPTIVATDADATISVPKGTTLDVAALKAKVTLSGGGTNNDDISEWSITKIEYKSDGTESDFTPTRDTITGEAVSTEASKWTITFNDGAKDIEVELKFEVVAVDPTIVATDADATISVPKGTTLDAAALKAKVTLSGGGTNNDDISEWSITKIEYKSDGTESDFTPTRDTITGEAVSTEASKWTITFNDGAKDIEVELKFEVVAVDPTIVATDADATISVPKGTTLDAAALKAKVTLSGGGTNNDDISEWSITKIEYKSDGTESDFTPTRDTITGEAVSTEASKWTITFNDGAKDIEVELKFEVVAVDPTIVATDADATISVPKGTTLDAAALKAKVTLSGGGTNNDDISEWSITKIEYKSDGTESDFTPTRDTITGEAVSTEASKWTITFNDGAKDIEVELKFEVVAVDPTIVATDADATISVPKGTTLDAAALKAKVTLSGGGTNNDDISEWSITSVAYKDSGKEADLTTTGGIDITGAVVSTGEASTWTIRFANGGNHIDVDLKFKVVAVEPKIVPAVVEDIELTVGTTLNAGDLKDKVQLSGGGAGNDAIADWTITSVAYKGDGQSGDLTTEGNIDITAAVVNIEASTWTITFTNNGKNIPVDLKFKVVAVEPKIVPAVVEDIELTVGTTLNAGDLKDKVQLSGGGAGNDAIADWTITSVAYKGDGQSGDLTTTGNIDITAAVVNIEASTWTITFTNNGKNIPVDLKFKVVAVEPKIVPAVVEDIELTVGTTLNAGDLKDKVQLSGGGAGNDAIADWTITSVAYKGDGQSGDLTTTGNIDITAAVVNIEASTWTITFTNNGKNIPVDLKFKVVAVEPKIVPAVVEDIELTVGTTLNAGDLKDKVQLSGGGAGNDAIADWTITSVAYKGDGQSGDLTTTGNIDITAAVVNIEASTWTITFTNNGKNIPVDLKFKVVAVEPKIVPAVVEDIELTVGTTLNAGDLKDKVQLSGGGAGNDAIADWTITSVAYKGDGQSGDLTTTGNIDITAAVVNIEASTWTITFTNNGKNIPVDLKFKVVAVEPKIVPAVVEDIELTVGTTLNAGDLKDKVQLSGGGAGNDAIADWTITSVAYKGDGQSGDLTTTGNIDITAAVVNIEASTWTITFTNGSQNIDVDLKFKVVAVEALVLKNGSSITMGKGDVLTAYNFRAKFAKDTGASVIGNWSIIKVEHNGAGGPSDLIFDGNDQSLTANQVATLSEWTITFESTDPSIGDVTLDVDFVVLEKSARDVKSDYSYSNDNQKHEWGNDSTSIGATPTWLNKDEHGSIAFLTSGVRNVWIDHSNSAIRPKVSAIGVVSGSTKPGIIEVVVKITGGTKYAGGTIDRFEVEYTKKTGETIAPTTITEAFVPGKVISNQNLLDAISDKEAGYTVQSVLISSGDSVAVNTNNTSVKHVGVGATDLIVTLTNDLYEDIDVIVTVTLQ